MNNIKIHSEKRNYNVIVYDNIVKLIENNVPSCKKVCLIYDSFFNNSTILDTFAKTNKAIILISVDGGENAKSLTTYEKIITKLSDNSFSKNDCLIALGGGTICDLVGFVAATYKRGINYISFPTTTLAMIDASIGGKTALNFGKIKNLIGIINPPQKVLIGLDVLNTLDERNYNNGLAEALKMGMVYDRKIFDLFLSSNFKEESFLKNIIVRSIKAKSKIVKKDEYDNSLRKILNFGHTIGHAIETTYDGFLHGEAVANGMLILSKNETFYNDFLIIIYKMNIKLLNKVDSNIMLKQLNNDKKISNNQIDLVRVAKIGKAYIEKTSIEKLKGEIDTYVF